MSANEPERPGPGIARSVACAVWVLAVGAAYCVAFGGSLIQAARHAADRFPFLSRLLELLHLGS